MEKKVVYCLNQKGKDIIETFIKFRGKAHDHTTLKERVSHTIDGINMSLMNNEIGDIIPVTLYGVSGSIEKLFITTDMVDELVIQIDD